MTLQTQQPTPEHSPAVLTDEQRRRVADALENAQSVNTRRNYAGQFRKFCEWCEHRNRAALPAPPEVVAAYPTELVSDGKSMSTVRFSVAAIVDAHRRVGLESTVNAGVSETLYGLAGQTDVNQKQAKLLDAYALVAHRLHRRVVAMKRKACPADPARSDPQTENPTSEDRCRTRAAPITRRPAATSAMSEHCRSSSLPRGVSSGGR